MLARSPHATKWPLAGVGTHLAPGRFGPSRSDGEIPITEPVGALPSLARKAINLQCFRSPPLPFGLTGARLLARFRCSLVSCLRKAPSA